MRFIASSYQCYYHRDSLRELKTCKSKMDTQSKQVSEYASRMDEYDKKFEENSRKFGTLLAVRFTDSLRYYFDKQILPGTEQMQNRAAVLPVSITSDAGN